MEAHQIYTLSQISSHNGVNDCWVAIGGKVIDVTNFLQEHPGGDVLLLEVAGKDATQDFKAIGHSKGAKSLLLRYQVGVVEGFEAKAEEDVAAASKDRDVAEETATGKATQTMTGFPIEDGDDKSNSHGREFGLIQFLVPLLIACLVFWYRCSSTITEMFS
ncbi:cytochrome b5-like [Ananas comosus]|uniref:Cytochrome b5-like n=1 Tax=Ananas comosus TaxID=4615 RepID=A0A6P5GB42_ANACO|nr:cytochrome b5-like [Ananas comosus]